VIGYPERTDRGRYRSRIEHGFRRRSSGDNGRARPPSSAPWWDSLKPLEGEVRWGTVCKIGRLCPARLHQLPRKRPSWATSRSRPRLGKKDQEILEVAGALLSVKRMSETDLDSLWRGTGRLCLAALLLTTTTCLILDEPANHLRRRYGGRSCRGAPGISGTVVFHQPRSPLHEEGSHLHRGKCATAG